MSVTEAAPVRCLSGIHVDGAWRSPADRSAFAVHDPASGAVLAEVLDATVEDALDALDSADRAQAGWAATPARTRAEILRRAFTLVVEHGEELAATITAEMGKSLGEARTEVGYGAEFLRWFSEETTRIGGRTAEAPEGGTSIHVGHKPIGPCYLVTPWNFPLAMITRKVAPALAAGCTVVLKPADLTPLTAIRLVELLAKAGVPAGVVNLVTTSSPAPVSSALLADRRLRKVSFTGSTAVGRLLLRQAADNVVRCSMELGGNAPFVVLAGANLDDAIEGAMAAKFRNIGQACTAANRFLVHDSLADEFARRLADRAGRLTIGPGSAPGTDLGPLISPVAVQRGLRIIDDALARGATLLTGGRRLDGPGNFIEPTVLLDVAPGSLALTEEIFAPIAPIARFDTTAQAIAQANATEYGLASYVYAPTPDAGHAVAGAIEAGMVGVNTGIVSNAAAPFGGVKSSGLGREGGTEGIAEYLATQYTASPRYPVG